MDHTDWLQLERDAIANARAARFADVQLLHYGLAQRYSIEAAKAESAQRKPKRSLGKQLTTAFHL